MSNVNSSKATKAEEAIKAKEDEIKKNGEARLLEIEKEEIKEEQENIESEAKERQRVFKELFEKVKSQYKPQLKSLSKNELINMAVELSVNVTMLTEQVKILASKNVQQNKEG